jgi:hypothetical protein
MAELCTVEWTSPNRTWWDTVRAVRKGGTAHNGQQEDKVGSLCVWWGWEK